MNPAHSHSEYRGQEIASEHLRLLEEAIPRLELEGCACFVLCKFNETIGCPICLSDILLSRCQNAHKIFNICGSKYLKVNEAIFEQLVSEKEDYEIYTTPCGHLFHAGCLAAWLTENENCPVDRSNLPPMSK